MKKLFVLIFLFFFAETVTFSQYVPGVNNRMTLLAHLNNYSVYSNIWGWTSSSGREYVLIGHNQGTSVVDITDPTQPVERAMVAGPHPASGTIWREITSYSHYAYIVSEHTSPSSLTGVQIVDLSYLPDSVHYVQSYRWPGVAATNAKAHSVSVDDQGAYLYIQGGNSSVGGAGANSGGLRILSLSDPENPVSIATLPTRYVHDCFVRNNILFASNINNNGHVDIWNIADKAHPHLIHTLTYPNGFSHNSAVSDDNRFLYTTDEISGATVKTWNIEALYDDDTTNNDNIQLTSEYIGNPAAIAHNIYVNGHYAYLSHYSEGVKILDIANPEEPVEVAYYDTHLNHELGFVGDWGVYPFFPSGTVAVSDIEAGLYIFRFDTAGWGGIKGTVRNSLNNQPLPNTPLYFLEAQKTVLTDAEGNYQIKLTEGTHTVAISRVGFYPETLSVQAALHDFNIHDISLGSQNAIIQLNHDSLGTALQTGANAEFQLDVTNQGTGDLFVHFQEINGHQGKHKARTPANPEWLLAKKLASGHTLINNGNNSPQEQKVINYQLLVEDTPDDVLGSSPGPDVKAIYGDKDSLYLYFKVKFYQPVNMDSATLGFALDVDQNELTGGVGIGIYQGEVGADYDVFINVPAFPAVQVPAKSVTIFKNVGGGNPLILGNIVEVGSDSTMTFSIRKSYIGNDDGNVNFVAAGYFWANGVGTGSPASAADIVPNTGHAAIGYDPLGEISWLSLNSYDDTITGGNTKIIHITFDATGLGEGERHHGLLIIHSNDGSTPELRVPMELDTYPLAGVTDDARLPLRFSLQQNFPNPFNPTTAIGFSLFAVGEVSLKVYNVLGQEVAILLNNVRMEPGVHSVSFDAANLASGMYYYKLTSGENVALKKMVVLK